MIKAIKKFWKKETFGTKICVVVLITMAIFHILSSIVNNNGYQKAKEVNIITTTSSDDVIDYVKKSYLDGYDTFTIGQCVEGYLHNIEWGAYIDGDGNKYITAIGDTKSIDKEPRQCIHFYIDTGSTEIVFTGLCYEDGTRYAEGYDGDYYPYVEKIFNGGFIFQ